MQYENIRSLQFREPTLSERFDRAKKLATEHQMEAFFAIALQYCTEEPASGDHSENIETANKLEEHDKLEIVEFIELAFLGNDTDTMRDSA